MKLLFLDIDGVLNNHIYYEESQSTTMDEWCVGYLNKIITTEPDLHVVVSSAWRYMMLKGAMTLQGFKYLLQTHGVSSKINLIGCCGEDWEEDYRNRGVVINQWLENFEHKDKVKKILILDDCPPGMTFKPVQQYLYRTSSRTGLTPLDVCLIKDYLNDKYELTDESNDDILEVRKEN